MKTLETTGVLEPIRRSAHFTAAYTFMDTPVGQLQLIANSDALLAVLWPTEQPKHLKLSLSPDATHPILKLACTQLAEYFLGQRQQFNVPIAFVSGTVFQQAVWQALLSIPYGQTCSYKAIAEQVGSPKAVRAVGAANGQNPLSIIVPCHRVIGVNQTLVGYAGGVEQKHYLLELEKNHKLNKTT